MEISSLSPIVGPLSGGNTVTITGTKFTGATSVTFGGVPVPAFTINSATQITVSVPAGLSPGQVDVTVTTPSGTVTVVNAYAYLQGDFASGDGTTGNPYVIADAEQLDKVRDHLDAHFVLSGDIDLGVAPYNTGSGWTPIGTQDNPFTGTFDGGGNSIGGLYINGEQKIGLFGSIAGDAEISNLALENADVTSTFGITGILVGYMDGGTIEDSHVTGSVTGDGINVGGMVGYMRAGKITDSSAEGEITNESDYTGGLVGAMDRDAEMFGSFADTTINGKGYVGGLVGTNLGSIEQSFAKGSVQSNWIYLGGLVGKNESGGTISQSYSWSAVTGGTEDVAGLTGYNGGNVEESYATGYVNTSASAQGGLIGANIGTINSSYYDVDTTGQSDTGKGTPLTTSEMKQQASYSGWDFTNVWHIQEGSGYPTLQWE
ncbi:GLUG motif-containing protein [Brevibacillus nitrificans]|uniref:GLUG motif-containing protein n=1 Tax=Brevibacillus nitrificans TaxID=651560 RepID=UPI0026157C77|nr:GLUG motif-containing protein [Brevibacillus nitrificans]